MNMSDATYDSDTVDPEFLMFYRTEYVTTLVLSVSYGLYLAFSGTTLYVLLAKGTNYLAKRWTLTYMALMFIVVTTWYVLASMDDASLFVEEAFFPESLQLATRVCSILQFLLSDGVLVFRMYLSWNRNVWITLVPALLYLVSAVCGAVVDSYTVSIWAENVHQTVELVFFAATVVLNILVTLAIAYKVLLVMRNAPGLGCAGRGIKARARATFIIVLESGAVYSVVGLVAVPLFGVGQISAELPLSLLQILSSLNPAFMILRLVTGTSYEYYEDTSGSRPVADHEKGLPPHPE